VSRSATASPILNTEWTLVCLSEQLADALENCYRCKPIQGSNPCPSAIFVFDAGSPEAGGLRVLIGGLTGRPSDMSRDPCRAIPLPPAERFASLGGPMEAGVPGLPEGFHGPDRWMARDRGISARRSDGCGS
jgi:hypothetical protein